MSRCQSAGPAPGILNYVSVVGHFCGRESNCQILCRSLELIVWCFQKELNYLFGVSEKVLNYLFGVSQKSRVFALRIMSFHKNPKRCDLIRSLNGAKAFSFQLNVRYSLVGLTHRVVTEKLRFP